MPVTDSAHTLSSSRGNTRNHDLSDAHLSTKTPTGDHLTPSTGYAAEFGATRCSTVIKGVIV